MSKLEVDAIEPQSGTTLTIGASGDSVNIASGATITDFTSTGIDDNATANALTIDSSSNLQFNSGYGSVATAYGCRAWVNFNGTGTVAIRGSGNVSSITDLGVGNYDVNFGTNMADTNYAVVNNAASSYSTSQEQWVLQGAYEASAVQKFNLTTRLVDNDAPSFVAHDVANAMIGVFR